MVKKIKLIKIFLNNKVFIKQALDQTDNYYIYFACSDILMEIITVLTFLKSKTLP